MGLELKINAVNQIPRGTEIFLENEPASYVCVIIRGRVCEKNEAIKQFYGPATFLGACDLFVGHYIANYIAEEDTMLYAFQAGDKNALLSILENNNKEYRGLMVNSLAKNFYELSKINQQFHKMAADIYTLLSDSYAKYKSFCRDAGEGAMSIAALESMEAYAEDETLDRSRFAYFEDLARIPADIQKNFFGCGTTIAMEHVKEISGLIANLMIDTKEVCEYLNDYVFCLYNDGAQNLLSFFMKLATEAAKKNRAVPGLQAQIDKLLDEFNRVEQIMTKYMGMPPVVNRERLERIYSALLTNEEIENDEEDSAPSEEEVLRTLKGSFQQIMDFSELSKENTKTFCDYMAEFIQCKDRLSPDDEVRMLRRKLADGFYLVYKAVFIKALKTAAVPRAVELFLDYGYIDERLLTKEQLLELNRNRVESVNKYHCNIFTMREWLTAVYTGKRQPSKNEFDMEYLEMLRDRKKAGEINAEEEKRLATDNMKKLEFEIQNMFRCNHRVVNGQPSVFVPVLCSEQMLSGPGRAMVSKDRMGQVVEKYREIDYSVFYRELTFADAETKIEKELIMKEIVPDIILFPAYGQNAAMWQELSCKRRDSGGRFMFPIMVEGSLDDLIIRTFGRFRWELCRTMQGSSWNNIQYKSLTAEYSDYIQFYRKNKDLTEERKEKVKIQISKGKNNLREIFVQDYELWVKAEAMGAMRLNRVSREILAMYCPFNKEIRNALETQPAFADAIGHYKRENQKKVRELELRYHAITTKQNVALPAPMVATLNYYKEK